MFISHAYAQQAGAPQASGDLFSIGLLVFMFVVFYVIAIRPQRKRQKEHQAMVAALAKGDEVITASGILGKIVGLDDNYISLQVANNVNLKFQRSYINAVLPKGTLKSVGAE
jgi:preprotein translocase subunit YajC